MVEEARTRRNLQRVAEAAREWTEHGRNRAYLFRGLKLARRKRICGAGKMSWTLTHAFFWRQAPLAKL